jgi:hypothetical protein
LALFASDPVPGGRSKGTVLILDNDRTLHGDIERGQGGYLIRRDMGELWLPASQVKCLCADWDEALQRMRSQFNPHDPDERLKLARWCEQNGLYAGAIAEIKQALIMRPKHVPTLKYLQHVEHAARVAERPPAPAQPATKENALAPSLDLNAESLSLFVTKVQPILMNTCAQCHANGQGGEFKLMRTGGIGASWHRATQFNMAAVVQQLNLNNAPISPLLIKAVSAHGTAAKPPIASRSAAPYQTMKQWAEMTIASNPHLRLELNLSVEGQAKAAPPPTFATQTTTPAKDAPVIGNSPGALPAFGPAVPLLTESPPVAASGVKSAVAVQHVSEKPSVVPATTLPPPLPPPPAKAVMPAAPQEPADEFDRILFNQWAHPDKK